MTRCQKLTLFGIALAALVLFLAWLATGCAVADYSEAVYLNDKRNPWQQAKEAEERKALADDQTKRVKHEAIMSHAHKHATNSIFVPIPLARPGDASISTEDADPKRAVITPAKLATNGVDLPVGLGKVRP